MSYERLHNRNKLRSEIAAKLRSTPIGRLASEISTLAATRTVTQAKAKQLRQQFDALTRGADKERLAQTAVMRKLEEVERYSKGTPGGAWGWLAAKLGPLADALKSMIRPTGEAPETKELRAAAELLSTLGTRTEGAQGRRVAVQADDPRTREEAEQALRALGFTVEPHRGEPPAPPAQRPRLNTSGMQRKYLSGQSTNRIRPDDPILTGEMIPVSSSNVHSIGFLWNEKNPESGTLKVRYLDSEGGKKTARGGATYHYFDIHPNLFLRFQKASSKGKFVWDNLRVRGTVSGHQCRYSIAGLSSSGYVPRKATRVGSEEWYVKRTVTDSAGNDRTSQLSNAMVRQLSRGQMATGKMHDGRVNDGRIRR